MNRKDRDELRDVIASKTREKEQELREAAPEDRTNYTQLALQELGIANERAAYDKQRDTINDLRNKFEDQIVIEQAKLEAINETMIKKVQDQGYNVGLGWGLDNLVSRKNNKLKEEAFANSDLGKKIKTIWQSANDLRTQLIYVDASSEVKSLIEDFQAKLDNE